MNRLLGPGLLALACAALGGCQVTITPRNNGSSGGGTYGGDSSGSTSAAADDGSSSGWGTSNNDPPPSQGHVHRTHSGPTNPPPAQARGRNRWRHLPDMGKADRYFRNTTSQAAVDRGYYEGDCQFDNAGRGKRGAGIDETVIDGDVEINGDNWMIQNLTITGDVTITGSNNDLSTCKILGRVQVRRGTGNRTP